MSLIFGESNEVQELESHSRQQFKNHHITERPKIHKGSTNTTMLVDETDAARAAQRDMYKRKTVVDKEVRDQYNDVRVEARRNASKRQVPPQQLQLVNTKEMHMETTYAAQCAQRSKPVAEVKFRSSFPEETINPIFGVPTKTPPCSFEHPKAGCVRVSGDAVRKKESVNDYANMLAKESQRLSLRK